MMTVSVYIHGQALPCNHCCAVMMTVYTFMDRPCHLHQIIKLRAWLIYGQIELTQILFNWPKIRGATYLLINMEYSRLITFWSYHMIFQVNLYSMVLFLLLQPLLRHLLHLLPPLRLLPLHRARICPQLMNRKEEGEQLCLDLFRDSIKQHSRKQQQLTKLLQGCKTNKMGNCDVGQVRDSLLHTCLCTPVSS